ncbi:MAG: hypothetical protein KBT31_00820 [Firmicutes bacterium]|nr:hypothetical protein [Candidatus Colimorpha enterica]
MKKTVSFILAFIMFAFALCGCEKESINYLSVAGSSTMTVPSYGTEKMWSRYYPDHEFDDVPKTVTEDIFGTEYTLYYKYSAKTDWIERMDVYETEREDRKTVIFDNKTGELIAVADMSVYYNNEPVPESEWLTDEEYKQIAGDFVKERWPFLENNMNIVVQRKAGYAELNIYEVVNGFSTKNTISIWLKPDGEMCRWQNCLVFPEGIPENVKNGIKNADIALCKKSIEKHVENMAKEFKDRKIKFIKHLDYTPMFYFTYDDPRLFVQLFVTMSIDGEECDRDFYVNVPY